MDTNECECSRAKRALECGGALPLFDSPEMSNEEENLNDEARLRPNCAVFAIRAAPRRTPLAKAGNRR